MLRKVILEKLKQHGVMPTSQRIEVASILLARPQHLSADQIIDKLQGRGSRVSKATVYNTLKLFSKHGIVKELSVDSSRKFYDSTTHPHHHFYHVDSGKLSDIPEGQVSIGGLPSLPKGTEQESVEVLIRVRNKRR
jgi:Fur family iron response transcriptional regulator